MATLKMVAIPMLTGLSSTACVGGTFDGRYVWCISNSVAAHHLALDTRLFVVHKVGMPDEPGALFDKPLGGVFTGDAVWALPGESVIHGITI